MKGKRKQKGAQTEGIETALAVREQQGNSPLVSLVKNYRKVSEYFEEIKQAEYQLSGLIRSMQLYEHPESTLDKMLRPFQRLIARASGLPAVRDFIEDGLPVYEKLEESLRDAVVKTAQSVDNIVEHYREEQRQIAEMERFLRKNPTREQLLNYIEGTTATPISENIRMILEESPVQHDYRAIVEGVLQMRKKTAETAGGIAVSAAHSFHEAQVNLFRYLNIKDSLIVMSEARRAIDVSSQLSEGLMNFLSNVLPTYQQTVMASLLDIIEREKEWGKFIERTQDQPNLFEELEKLPSPQPTSE
ncbi:hypothetical protein D6745_00160 [Candidatus Woesearchaeota archaeon]|nr:MAG: hypothetical protein D6745_00160 [Candidatus Woesearchaeota archaeon]